MTLRIALLTAAAAIALPADAALAQTQPTDPAMTPPVATPEPAAAEPANADAATGSVVEGAADAATDAATDAPAAAVGATTLATPADVKAGVMVHDQTGAMVGTVESVDAKGAVVATGKSRVQIPVASFGKNDKGLVLGTTKAELDAQAAPKTPA